MKRLILALSLILCLVLCVFAFASCKKSGGDKPATEPEATETTPVETEHVHTPDAEKTVDVQPSCVAVGSKSTHCTTCGQIIPGTEEEIAMLEHTPEANFTTVAATCKETGMKYKLCEACGNIVDDTIETLPIDPDAHKVEEWSAEPTLLNPSVEATGECIICRQPITKTLAYKPPVTEFTENGVKFKPVSVTLGEIRGDKHFYPTEEDSEGNDLYVEFSILWNETLGNLDAAYMIGSVGSKPFFFLAPYAGAKYADSPFAGTFEWMGHFEIPISDSEVTTLATMCGASENFSDYPNIAGTDQEHPEYGWHRMGIRVHMELLDGKTGEDLKDYEQISTIFVDGVALCKLSTDPAKGLASDATKLFTAAPDEGGTVVYSDMDENMVVPFEIPTAKSKIDTTACIAIDDVSVSCGKGFVMPVEKVADPATTVFEIADGVEVPSTIWFQLVSN